MLHVVTTGAYYPPVVTTWKILTTGASQSTAGSLCTVAQRRFFLQSLFGFEYFAHRFNRPFSKNGQIFFLASPVTFLVKFWGYMRGSVLIISEGGILAQVFPQYSFSLTNKIEQQSAFHLYITCSNKCYHEGGTISRVKI